MYGTKRILLIFSVVLTVCLSAAAALAVDLPVVYQPNDPALTAADRTALAAACAAVTDLLQQGYPLSAVRMGKLGWGDSDFARYAAGRLQSAGYTAFLATGSWAGASQRTWILVGVPVSFGFAYIPVEAAPAHVTSAAIGQIAWQSGATGAAFDTRYTTYSQAEALPPNLPPAATLSIAEKYAVIDETTTFQVHGGDPDGVILAYVWTISDGTELSDTRSTLWYTFRKAGNTVVSVTVYDTRGGSTFLSLLVDVLTEKPDCGCHSME